MTKSDFKINLPKAITCSKYLKDYFSSIEDNSEVIFPNSIQNKSYEYIIYIFYSCLLDYGTRSKIYHRNLVNTYNKYPFIFDPKYIVDNYIEKSDELRNIIVNNIHPRYPNVATKKWLDLSLYLNDNDNLYDKIKSVKSYQELESMILNIKGFGQKTGGLLLRLIYESGICNFTFELLNIPIDRHDIEISYLNGVTNEFCLNNDEISDLGKTWVKAAKENNLDPALIDRYLWAVGNTFCNNKNCMECPLSKTCRRKSD